MLVKSKFSRFSLARYLFFIPVCIIFILVFGIYYFDENYEMPQRSVMFVLAIFGFGLIIIFLLDVCHMVGVRLDEEKITASNLVSGKKEFFYYKDIVEVKSINNKTSFFRKIPLTDGYHSRIYVMADGRTLELSPDVFENYGELVNNISKYTSHLEHVHSLHKRV